MSGTRPLIAAGAAGQLTPERVALRWTDEAGALRLEESSQARFAASHAIGPFSVTLAPDVGAREATIGVQVENTGALPAGLAAVVLGFRWREHGLASYRYLRHGWQSWSLCDARELDDRGEPAFPSGAWLRGTYCAYGEPPADRVGWHESDLLTVVGAATDGPVCAAGSLESGQAFGVVYLRRDGADLCVEIELVVDALFPPGQRRDLDAVRVALGFDANALLEEQADALGRRAGARTRAPFQAGWCSWYHFFHRVSEQDVLRNLDALAGSRDEIPIDLVQIDDGYQSAIGDWLETNAKFPRGLAPLAEDIRSAGFTAGIWTAPFLVAPASKLCAEHPEWLLRSGDDPAVSMIHPEWNPADAVIYGLDTSQQEVLAHLARVFAQLTAMGFSYHKIDFLFAPANTAEAADPGVSRAARLRRGLLAIRRGIGEESFLLGCGCPLGPAVGIVDGMRIGPDVAPSWEVAAPTIPIPGIERTQPSTRNGLRSIYKRAFQHRRLWLNDPDCLMTRSEDTGLTPGEARSLAAAVAVTGGMVLFSDDVPELGPESRALLGDTIALAREVDSQAAVGGARCVDLLAEEIARGARAPAAGGDLLALLNPGEARADVTASLRELAARPRQPEPVSAWRDGSPPATAADGVVRASLEAHHTALLRLPGGPPLAVFCDFDGTFAVQDVGASLAMQYAADRRPALWARYERGELDAWAYNMELLDGIEIPEAALDAFLHTIELDPGAAPLLSWCQAEGIPFRILSDGFDRNLDRLRVLTGVPFEYEANHLRYEDGRWRIAPGAPDPDCGCGTGVCKRGRIAAFRRAFPDTRVAYIGNGRVSDRCASHAADRVFAKDTLADALDEDAVAYERYQTLDSVLASLQRELAAQGGGGVSRSKPSRSMPSRSMPSR